VFVRAGTAFPIGPVVQSTRPLEGDTPVVAVAEFGYAMNDKYEVCVRGSALVKKGGEWRSYDQRVINVKRFL
ncbi:MAG: hypothetical protein ACRCWJ_10565, partial [Casimicrobium sp.]